MQIIHGIHVLLGSAALLAFLYVAVICLHQSSHHARRGGGTLIQRSSIRRGLMEVYNMYDDILAAVKALDAAKLESQTLPYDVFTEARASHNKHHFFIPPGKRENLGVMLEAIGGFRVGVELSPRDGAFSKQVLEGWPSCTKYYLVDAWAHQDNYTDVSSPANVIIAIIDKLACAIAHAMHGLHAWACHAFGWHAWSVLSIQRGIASLWYFMSMHDPERVTTLSLRYPVHSFK